MFKDEVYILHVFKFEKLPVEPLNVVVEIVDGKVQVEALSVEKFPVDALSVVVVIVVGLKVETLKVEKLPVDA